MIRIALAQVDLPVGDIDGNVTKIEAAMAEAAELGAQVIAFPVIVATSP